MGNYLPQLIVQRTKRVSWVVALKRSRIPTIFTMISDCSMIWMISDV